MLFTLKSLSFWYKYIHWWVFAYMVSVFNLNFNFSSAMVPRYLYFSTTSISWPWIQTGSRDENQCLWKSTTIPFVLNTLMSRKDCPHHATTGPWSWSVSWSRETKQVPIGTRKNSLDRLHWPHWSQYSTVGKEIVRNAYHRSLNPFQRSERITHLVRVTVLLGLQLPIILVIEQSVSSDKKNFGLSNEHKYSKEKKHASFRMSCSLVSIFKMGMI